MAFFSSKRQFERIEYECVSLCLVKIKTPKGTSVFATNLPKHMFDRKQIKDLYKLRWQIETCFFDLSTSCHIEAWHSKTENGIRQELYLRLWLLNLTRLLTRPCQRFAEVGQTRYSKLNFRLVLTFIRDNLYRYWTNIAKLYPHVKWMITHSSETRLVDKRLSPRVVKSPRSPYKYRSTEWQWDKKWALT